MSRPMNRRRFLQQAASTGSLTLAAAATRPAPAEALGPAVAAPVGIPVPDSHWQLWIDEHAAWADDVIHLPGTFNLATLPVNPPTGGWQALAHPTTGLTKAVTLPATVEEHFWARFGTRPYTPDEYRYAADDPIPQDGAYRGVSWWSRPLDIPTAMRGQRILLHIRGARMRAEVFLNQQLVGYSILEELPFTCDLTAAARPGTANQLAIRITNPGGRYDWVDGGTIPWGKLNVYRSHGFGGLDRGITLQAVPLSGHIADTWVLNTPAPRTVDAFVSVAGTLIAPPLFEILDPQSGKVLASAHGTPGPVPQEPSLQTLRTSLTCPTARLWDLDRPILYQLRTTLTTTGNQTDTRLTTFGFRWFAPEGLGTNALFRLNGRRIKLYSSISWGFWGINGVWPTPALAEREVTQAKRLGLNCLNFHRNVGKEDVFEAHDRLGLLRYMEPGGGKLAIGKVPAGAATNAPDMIMAAPANPADRFSRDFMLAKCKAMVRAFRSHPSLIEYCLQNEIGADLNNPQTFTPLEIMHREDPSRSVVLNDGFVAPPRNAAQAWFSPYNETMHRSDQEPWAGWWNNHQGAGDQWYDEFYKDTEHFTYRQPLKTALVEFGEMEGCAVADNHPLMIHQIESHQFGSSGISYDLEDHRQILTPFDQFLTRWGFRKAFPTAEQFYRALGNKVYESWQQYMENARICDEIDYAVISGWESTAIENHSGIVDNLRNFKGDPDLILSSLRPIRPVAKQHHLCYALGDPAVFDLYLLNDTGAPVTGSLHLSVVDPAGRLTPLGTWPAPPVQPDIFSYPVKTAFTSPALTHEGIYRFHFKSDAAPLADFSREIWVAQAQPRLDHRVTVALSGVLPAIRQQLAHLPGVVVADFKPGAHYDLILASGVIASSKLNRAVGDETGLEAQPAAGSTPPVRTPGHIPDEVLAAVYGGTPLLAMVPDDDLADGVCRQLSALGAFTYTGQVGDTRAPWMGNWLFVRQHPTFAGLPTDRVLGIHYQAHGKSSNGLLVDRAPAGEELEVIMAYSRDHDRRTGAASFIAKLGSASILVHRAPSFSPPLQQRWLANAISHLTNNPIG